MATRQWLRAMSSMKVKEVPAYVRENMTRDKVKAGVKSWFDEYCDAYIKTSSIQPLIHVGLGVFLIGYAASYPTELRHYQHAEEERIKKIKENWAKQAKEAKEGGRH